MLIFRKVLYIMVILFFVSQMCFGQTITKVTQMTNIYYRSETSFRLYKTIKPNGHVYFLSDGTSINEYLSVEILILNDDQTVTLLTGGFILKSKYVKNQIPKEIEILLSGCGVDYREKIEFGNTVTWMPSLNDYFLDIARMDKFKSLAEELQQKHNVNPNLEAAEKIIENEVLLEDSIKENKYEQEEKQ